MLPTFINLNTEVRFSTLDMKLCTVLQKDIFSLFKTMSVRQGHCLPIMQAANWLKHKGFLPLGQCEARDNAIVVHLLAVDAPANYNGRCRLVSNIQITPFLFSSKREREASTK